jgi:hypothetical protein
MHGWAQGVWTMMAVDDEIPKTLARQANSLRNRFGTLPAKCRREFRTIAVPLQLLVKEREAVN